MYLLSFAVLTVRHFSSYCQNVKIKEAGNRLLRSLAALNRMARNPECLQMILHALSENMNTLTKMLQDSNSNQCHAAVSTLLHNLLKVGNKLKSIHTLTCEKNDVYANDAFIII